MPPKKETLSPDEARKKVEAAIEELVTLAQLHEKAVKASTKTTGKAQARAMRAVAETRQALTEAVDSERALFTSYTTSSTSPNLFDESGPARGKVTPIADRTEH